LFDLQFLLLHLEYWVLGLLLCLHLCSLTLALLKHLLCGLRHHAGERQLDLWWQLLVFWRQRHAQLLFDLLAI
jgi:hypothetical protein